ncbi:uncharacterized protein TrAFT101_003885 [Trichoderma asperellum]|nr:hypothetical protein TrAFT101_003885 [Trichoderma asperellum]
MELLPCQLCSASPNQHPKKSTYTLRSTNMMSSPTLPPELLLLIVEAVMPPNPHLLFPASNTTTRTLLALTKVSRATHAQATRLLRQRCMFIDSSRRLANILLCMPRLVPSLPPVLSLQHISELYIAPFRDTLDDLPTAQWVRELFCEVSETLRRLVVQMPFASLDPMEDHLSVRQTLRDGFEKLHKLEEFTCLEEYPMLSVSNSHTDVWRLWPELKRMVLFGAPVDSHWLWWDIATLPKLEHVVLARPVHLDAVNIKDEYFHKLPPEDVRLKRDIKIVLMDLAYELGTVRTEKWQEIDPEEKMTVEAFEVPLSFYVDDSPLEVVTQWARRSALDGSIWKLGGKRVDPEDVVVGENK